MLSTQTGGLVRVSIDTQLAEEHGLFCCYFSCNGILKLGLRYIGADLSPETSTGVLQCMNLNSFQKYHGNAWLLHNIFRATEKSVIIVVAAVVRKR